MAVLTKNTMPGDIQLIFAHVSVSNKSLGEAFAALGLVVSFKSPTMVSIEVERAFSVYGENIRLPMIEVLLHATVGDLAKFKNIRYWTSINAIVLPPFLTEAVVTDG